MTLLRPRLSVVAVLSCLVTIGFADVLRAQVPDLPGWDLVMNDEFDGTSLNTSLWTALDRRDSFNNELQYYHPNQVAVTGGNLELTAIDVPRQGKAYQSGLITSNALYGPGRFEARIWLPTSQGMWPAFWLNANNTQWPTAGEIDIMENRGSQPLLTSSAYHWQTDPNQPCCGGHQYVYDEYTATENGQPVNFHAGFHTYAMEWEETQLRFYVDGNLHYTVNENASRPIFETPKNIILNVAVGGTFGGDPDGTTIWPQTMQVDYVRYWQASGGPDPDPVPTELSNPSFEDSGGSLDAWTTYGNSIGNVSAQSEVSLDGHALKMYGQFNSPGNFSGAYQGIAVEAGDSVTADASAYIRSQDTLFGKSNEVFMKLNYFSEFGAALGSAEDLGGTSIMIADGSTVEDTWLAHQLTDIAPVGAEEVRLFFEFHQPGNDNGAIHIDAVSLDVSTITLLGDINGDGFVGLLDLDLILGTWNATITPGAAVDLDGDGFVGLGDLDIVLNNWNSGTSPPGSAQIPEPATLTLLGASGVLWLKRRA